MSEAPARGESLALSEVLRRCHRAELEPLARAVAIQPVLTLGRDKLAAAIEVALRRAGSNDIVNLVTRRGASPPYEGVVMELAKRHGVNGGSDLSALEQELVRRTQDEARQTALAPRRSLPIRAAVSAGLLVARLLMPLLGAAAGVGLLLWLGRRRDDVLLPAVAEVARLRALVARRVTVGVVGSPSSGKDATLRAVFGVDTGNIHPVAGATRAVAVYPVAGGDGLEVVNTPGLGDVQRQLTDETRAVLDQIDLYLFLVNAQGGVRAREKREWQRLSAYGRPAMVVLNKLDTVDEPDRARLLADTATKLELPPDRVIGAAMDPLPQLMDTPMGVCAIREWIHSALEDLGRGELPAA